MEYRFSERMKNLRGNSIREIFKLVESPEVISFAGGMPASECLPLDAYRTYTDELLSGENALSLLQYGATEGYRPLREAVAKHVGGMGIKASAENVLIVSGAQQGIDLCYKLFLNEGDVLLVEDPTYLAALHIAKTYRARAIGVRSEADGIDIVDLEEKIRTHRPKLLYLVPNFSNPTGKTLSEEKRRAIAKMTAEYGVIVLEDDPYRALRYSGRHLPAIKHFDQSENVVYLTSFSKTISPAMRVGAMIASRTLIAKFTVGKQATDVHTATLSQAVAMRFLREGELERRVEASLPVYRFKRDAMLKAMRRYFPKEAEFAEPEGGLFIWCKVPMPARELFLQAISQRVAFVCGSDFFADGKGEQYIRLNFSNESVDRIEQGIRILGDLLKR